MSPYMAVHSLLCLQVKATQYVKAKKTVIDGVTDKDIKNTKNTWQEIPERNVLLGFKTLSRCQSLVHNSAESTKMAKN